MSNLIFLTWFFKNQVQINRGLVKVSWVSKMGRNDAFQPKITHPKHFCLQSMRQTYVRTQTKSEKKCINFNCMKKTTGFTWPISNGSRDISVVGVSLSVYKCGREWVIYTCQFYMNGSFLTFSECFQLFFRIWILISPLY